MRRKQLKLLANLVRTLLLGVSCTAAGTAVVWKWWPDLVERLDAKILRWTTGEYYARWTEATDAMKTDLGVAAQKLERLVDDLSWVRRQDHLAETVVDCLSRLSQIGEARGDLPTAIYWQRRAAKFDDHSVHVDSRLGDLMCRNPETRDEGLAWLGALTRRFPGNPWTAPVLARNQVLAGKVEDAIATIVRSDQALRSNYWLVGWVPEGESDEYRTGTVPVRVGGDLVLRFRFDKPVRKLNLYPPVYHSGSLLEPRLRIQRGDAPLQLALASTETAAAPPPFLDLFQVTHGPGRLTTFGESGPRITIALPEAIAADTEFVFTTRELRRILPQLGDVLQMPAVSQRLVQEDATTKALAAQLRATLAIATANNALEIFWSGPGDATFAAERSARARLDTLPTEYGGAFDVVVRPPEPIVSRLRIDFPEGVGLRYRLTKVELIAGDRHTLVDVARAPLAATNSLRRDGDDFVITGGDPYFAFDVPGPPTPISAVAVRGEIR